MKFIEIDGCYSFDFLDKTTLVATSWDKNSVYRFTLLDVSSTQWTYTGKIKVERPITLKCVGNNVYVISCDKRLLLLRKEFNDTEILLENKTEAPSTIVEFNGELLVHFESTSQVLRFRDKEKLEPLIVPQKIGNINSISSSRYLTVSGSKGF